MTNMKDVNAEKSLVDCNPRSDTNFTNIDPVPGQCDADCWPSQKRVNNAPASDWTSQRAYNPLGIGQTGNCDPIQTGQITNDLDTPNRDVIYRYSRGFDACDEAMFDTFRNVKVLDEQGKYHTVPIVWASQEKAVDMILQDNVRKDNSLVVDRIRLPMLAIWNTGMAFDQSRYTYHKAYSLLPWLDPLGQTGFHVQEKFPRDTFFGVTRGLPINISYTLYIWTMYQVDMNQILEQAISKFSPVAYLQVKGVYWEVIVTLDSIQNLIDIEVGDAKTRVMKYQIGMTAKTYLPQPIYRFKSLPESLCSQLNPANPVEKPTFMTNEQMMSEIESLKQNIAELEKSMSVTK